MEFPALLRVFLNKGIAPLTKTTKNGGCRSRQSHGVPKAGFVFSEIISISKKSLEHSCGFH